jgi:hypothetical protein
MQKIHVHSSAQSAEDRADAGKVSKSEYLRPSRLAITAAALAAGLLVQTQGFTQVPTSPSPGASTANHSGTTSDPEKEARKTWHAVMRNIPLPGTGCFHARYPNVAWDSAKCEESKPDAHPMAVNRTVGAPAAGNGTDYVAQAQGLISAAYGKFFISGVTNETNVKTSLTTNPHPITGSNEYSLQLNTNNLCGSTTPANECTLGTYIHTAACGDYADCFVWQQFIYATDYDCTPYGSHCGNAGLFMQYWLYNWVGNCPHGWNTVNPTVNNGEQLSCWHNSRIQPVPNIPVTNLGDVILAGNAENGGNDEVALEYGDDSWAVSNTDNSAPCCKGGLDIASVWNQAEFNVVGDADLTDAQFNVGAQVIVLLELYDGSQSAPTCPKNVGTTGETNNLTLGACQTGVSNPIYWYGCNNSSLNICTGFEISGPYIEFSESNPYVCLACGPVVPGPPPPIEE